MTRQNNYRTYSIATALSDDECRWSSVSICFM